MRQGEGWASASCGAGGGRRCRRGKGRRRIVTGLIECERVTIAASQFFGMIQEVVIWPHVMAIGPASGQLPEAAEEAVLIFLSRYGRVGAGGA